MTNIVETYILQRQLKISGEYTRGGVGYTKEASEGVGYIKETSEGIGYIQETR